MNKQIAFLIPCYNESQTIGKVVKDCKEQIPEATVYVYDNNSSDNTIQIAQDAGAIVRKQTQQGKGNVIRKMFREIDADCYIMIDGDDTYPLEYAREMADKVLNEDVDMVIGDRLSSTYFTENKRPFHNVGNVLVRNTINLLFQSKIKDIMTGYRAFSYNFVKTCPVISKGFEVETEMTIHSLFHNLNVKDVVVDYRDRPKGSVSKLNTYQDGMKVLMMIFKLFKNYKPLLFFSIVGTFLLVLSAILFGIILAIYLDIGLVPNFPTLVISGFIAVAALISYFCGFILDVLANNKRQDFEFKLVQVELEKNKK